MGSNWLKLCNASGVARWVRIRARFVSKQLDMVSLLISVRGEQLPLRCRFYVYNSAQKKTDQQRHPCEDYSHDQS